MKCAMLAHSPIDVHMRILFETKKLNTDLALSRFPVCGSDTCLACDPQQIHHGIYDV